MTERKAGTSSIVAIGADHAGFALKEDLRKTLGEQGYTLRDFGTFSVDSVDYPDIAATVAEEVSAGHFEQAILVCGTGAGMAIAANKVAGVRAAGCSEPYTASMSRRHNNANVLCLGARVVGTGLALDIAIAFLESRFEGGRHARRVDKINALDNA